MSDQIYIPEGSGAKVKGAYLIAEFAGMHPNRCQFCYFKRRKIERCFEMACRAEEREDRKNVYFTTLERQTYESQK